MQGFLFVILATLAVSQAYAETCTTGDLLPDRADCNKYYECLGGKLVEMRCPAGTQWHDAIHQCDYPESADCHETEDPSTTDSTTSASTPTSTGTTPVPSKCPAVDDKNKDVFLPNPDDCGSFYKCSEGKPWLIKCPPNQEWSQELSRCDWPEIAKCNGKHPTTIAPTTTSSSGTTPVPNECPAVDDKNKDVFLPNPEDCGSFYKCSEGKPWLIKCPPNQEWSQELSRCDWPEVAKCNGKHPEPTTQGPSTTNSPDIPDHCPAVDGEKDVFIPNPKDCGSFYKCMKGKPYLIKCPPNQQWSQELSRCDWPEVAKCHETPVFGSEKTAAGEKKCPAVDGEDDVLLPNPKNCSTFFKCNRGKPVLQECPAGLQWNAELNVCDYPDNANCKETNFAPSQPEKPEGKPTTGEKKCPAVDGEDDVLLPNPKNCSTFFKCNRGKPVLQECPAGLQWNAELNVCDYPDNANCKETNFAPSQPETPEDKPTTVEKKCPAVDGEDDVLLPNPKNCSTFFKCNRGKPVLQECPAGLQWNAELNVCDYPDNANCKEKNFTPSQPETPEDKPTTVEKKCPAVDGEDDVLLPNPKNCSTFFKCNRGKPVLQECPAGLQWNAELNVCDYPDNANCKETNFAPSQPETPEDKPTTEEKKCPAEDGDDDVLLPNPKNCSTFFKCNRGKPVLQECPAGLQWSVEFNRCEYPDIAKCKSN